MGEVTEPAAPAAAPKPPLPAANGSEAAVPGATDSAAKASVGTAVVGVTGAAGTAAGDGEALNASGDLAPPAGGALDRRLRPRVLRSAPNFPWAPARSLTPPLPKPAVPGEGPAAAPCASSASPAAGAAPLAYSSMVAMKLAGASSRAGIEMEPTYSIRSRLARS